MNDDIDALIARLRLMDYAITAEAAEALIAERARAAAAEERATELERENRRHQTVNLLRFVDDPLWEQKDGWIADYVAREDFDAIPWRVAQSQQRLAARYGDALVRIRAVILDDEFTSIDDIAREALEDR